MRILFLGGTQFVGRHMVEAALAGGHEVSLFNRGRTNADLFPEAEKLVGDRDGGLDALQGRTWDVAVDVNGYLPRLVRDSAQLLHGNIGQYIFVSTISVYDHERVSADFTESAPLQTMEDESSEDIGAHYGALKVLCEDAVRDVFPDSGLSLRLGIVAGPYDPTDRVTYWPWRVAQGGPMVVMGASDRPVQYIDARDLADFTLLAAEKGLSGVVNTVRPWLTWTDFLAACGRVTGVTPEPVWTEDEALLADVVGEDRRRFGALPLAIPERYAALFQASAAAADSLGLRHRPVEETLADTLAWVRGRAADRPWQAGLSSAQESALLARLSGGE